MYGLSEICVKRPVLASMLVLAFVVAGLVAFPKLGIDRFPKTDLPTVNVSTNYRGASAVEVESEVTRVIENAVAGVAGIDELRSYSSDGRSWVLVTFNLNRSIDAAVQDVRDAVSGVVRSLPPDVDPPVIRKSDLDSSPILTLAVSGPRSARELYFLADRYVRGLLESSPGVGEVSIGGAAPRAIQVTVDRHQLAAHGLSILQVRDALRRQNVDVPAGRVEEETVERSLRTLGRFPAAEQFVDLVVDTRAGHPVRLGDLAEITDGTKEVRTLSRLAGQPTVILQIQRQSGENTVQVIEGIKERLPRCQNLLPEDVQITVLQDQSRYILAALHEIESHLITGSLLACLTVLLFMRSWRSTIIAAVAIPASIIATFAFMKLFDFTLNNVTMLALVLMVGVVIDDAIVVLENIFHCVEERGMDPIPAAIEGTRQIGLAVLASTLSLVIVFLPVSFLSSVTGRMLFQFGVTASVAIMVSMLVSFTLTPMMCSRLLRPLGSRPGSPSSHSAAVEHRAGVAASRGGWYGWLEAAYLAVLRWSLRYRPLTLALIVVVLASNYPLLGWVKQDYIPTNVDESEFEVSVSAAEGATLASMDEAMQRVEERLSELSGVDFVLSSAGTGGFGSVNRGSVYVRLQDIDGRRFSFRRLWHSLLAGQPWGAWEGNFSQRDTMTACRKLLSSIPELRCSVRNLTSLRQGPPVDIDFNLIGPDIELLAEYSERLRQAALEIPGIVDVDTTFRMDKPELLASIDRPRAAAMGIPVDEIAQTLQVAVGGDDRVSRYFDAYTDEAFDVELRLRPSDRDEVDAISQLYVRTSPGATASDLGSAMSDGWKRPASGAVASGGEPRGMPAGNGSGSSVAAASSAAGAMTRLDNLVDFRFATGAARIDRLDRQRMIAIRANIEPGYALSDRLAELHRSAAALNMPAGYETRVMGRGRELERTLGEFGTTFLLSFVFMYLVLAAQFEHLLHPLTILISLPLAIPFGLLSLYWGDETLNVYSALGILVLFGVVKKAAILQVDHTNTLRRQGMPLEEALLQANRDRLRPILMTTLSFVAGLMPLLLATGPGAEERRSIAVLVVGGQTLSLLLTLIAVPVVYSYLDGWSRRSKMTDAPGQASL
jgi:hydrophobic/amphiphilic exporter-1 (mainly G- bacteria), HAE1 family